MSKTLDSSLITSEVQSVTGKKAISYYPNYSVYKRAFPPSSLDFTKQTNIVHSFLNLKEIPTGSGLWQFVPSDTYADGFDEYNKPYLFDNQVNTITKLPSLYGTVGYLNGNIRKEIALLNTQRGFELKALSTANNWKIQQAQALYVQTPVDMKANPCTVSYGIYINTQKDIFNVYNSDIERNSYSMACLSGQISWINDNINGKYQQYMYADHDNGQVNDDGNLFNCSNIPNRYICCYSEPGWVQQCAVCGLNKKCTSCQPWERPGCNKGLLNVNQKATDQAMDTKSAQETYNALSGMKPILQNNGTAICVSCNQSNVINAGSQAQIINVLQSNSQTCAVNGIKNNEIPTQPTKNSNGPTVSGTADANGISHIPNPNAAPVLPDIVVPPLIESETEFEIAPATGTTLLKSIGIIAASVITLGIIVVVIMYIRRGLQFTKLLKMLSSPPSPSTPSSDLQKLPSSSSI